MVTWLKPLDFHVFVEVDATFFFVLDELALGGLIHLSVGPMAVLRCHKTNGLGLVLGLVFGLVLVFGLGIGLGLSLGLGLGLGLGFGLGLGLGELRQCGEEPRDILVRDTLRHDERKIC